MAVVGHRVSSQPNTTTVRFGQVVSGSKCRGSRYANSGTLWILPLQDRRSDLSGCNNAAFLLHPKHGLTWSQRTPQKIGRTRDPTPLPPPAPATSADAGHDVNRNAKSHLTLTIHQILNDRIHVATIMLKIPLTIFASLPRGSDVAMFTGFSAWSPRTQAAARTATTRAARAQQWKQPSKQLQKKKNKTRQEHGTTKRYTCCEHFGLDHQHHRDADGEWKSSDWATRSSSNPREQAWCALCCD